MSIKVIRPTKHQKHLIGAGDSSCFYFQPFDLSRLNIGGKGPYVRFARIEVKDKSGMLHRHAGAVFTYIASGSGYFIVSTMNGRKQVPVRQGDMIYTPPREPHLSVADPDTTMIEILVYVGAEEDDVQELV